MGIARCSSAVVSDPFVNTSLLIPKSAIYQLRRSIALLENATKVGILESSCGDHFDNAESTKSARHNRISGCDSCFSKQIVLRQSTINACRLDGRSESGEYGGETEFQTRSRMPCRIWSTCF